MFIIDLLPLFNLIVINLVYDPRSLGHKMDKTAWTPSACLCSIRRQQLVLSFTPFSESMSSEVTFYQVHRTSKDPAGFFLLQCLFNLS